MQGMTELAEEVFGIDIPIRLGLPRYVGGLSEVVRSPIYATAFGLVRFGQQLRREPSISRMRLSGGRKLILRIKDSFRGEFGDREA